MGGSLGKLSGYTDSVEMYSVESGSWLEGPKMSTSRYSHCAVALGNGSIIVKGNKLVDDVTYILVDLV
jgi:hypothetical protein